MADDFLVPKLLILGYSKLWLEFGFLTEQELENQLEIFETSDDKNTEHYRYGAFRSFLSSRKTLTDDEIEKYINLAKIDEDKMMASSALVDVLKAKILTDFQFEKICNELSLIDNSLDKIILHQQLFRKLKKEPFTEKLFEECFNKGNGAIHTTLIDFANKEQLERIAEKGLNRQARNIAKQKLRSSKFR
jgi:Ca2+-binding EF-hand superfamily protein